MRGKNSLLGILVILSFSCSQINEYSPKDLVKVTKAEMLERARNFKFPDVRKITFKNDKGQVITMDSLEKIRNPEEFAQDYYKDDEGDIVEIIIRKASEDDKIFHRKLLKVINDGPEPQRVEVDCAKKKTILQDVFERDQALRKEKRIDRKIDHENLEIITSLLDKCGMPTLTEVNDVQMAAIWAVLQHSSNKYRNKYMPILEAAANNGDIGWGTIAMMKDRTLMEDGQPQIYGTQVSRNPQTGEWELFELSEPEFVNKRREEVGFGPIQEYLDRWKIDFQVPQR